MGSSAGGRLGAPIAMSCGAFALAALACGPSFPNRLLISADSAVLTAPAAEFRREVLRLLPTTGPSARAVVPERGEDGAGQSARIDLQQLEDVLAARGVPEEQRQDLLTRWAALRAGWEAPRDGKEPARRPAWGDLPASLAARVPLEMALYMQGWLAWQAGDLGQAKAWFDRVLALPEAERPRRGSWAAYMLGRVQQRQVDAMLEEIKQGRVAKDAAAAKDAELVKQLDGVIVAFQRVRTLTAAGGGAGGAANQTSDPLGLAAASLGWEAWAHLQAGRFDEAAKLYLAQLHAGDPSALASVRMLAERLAATRLGPRGDQAIRLAARDPSLRRVFVAWLISRGGPVWAGGRVGPGQIAPAFLDALEREQIRDVQDADRLAFAAYDAGQLDAAQRWINRASADAPLGQFVRAMLLARRGNLDEAAAVMAQAAELFPENERWRDNNSWWVWEPPENESDPWAVSPRKEARARAGAMHLARGRYVQGLDLLLRSNYWHDSAWVAERVLTVEELKQYVDAAWPLAPTAPGPGAAAAPAPREAGRDAAEGGASAARRGGTSADELERGLRIRDLLSRRLVRAGRVADAVPYARPELRTVVSEYGEHLAAAENRDRLADDRALSFWKAAQIARAKGMQIMGTELAPDFAIYDGAFALESTDGEIEGRQNGLALSATPDEAARARRNDPTPDRRYHYRFVASELAWKSAQLLPDRSPQLARVLWLGGRWIANVDPKAADRFYKSLVTRAGNTPLGKEANRMRWFPSRDPADPGFDPGSGK